MSFLKIGDRAAGAIMGAWIGDALGLGRHVFLYSDNVAIADEAALKTKARQKGLLVMGPDCGTAIVRGVGLGFANRVRRGAVPLGREVRFRQRLAVTPQVLAHERQRRMWRERIDESAG